MSHPALAILFVFPALAWAGRRPVRKARLLAVGVTAILLALALAQPAPPIPPFSTTPSLTAYDFASETYYVRQPDNGGYVQLKLGARPPYGLVSSAASLMRIIGGSVKFSVNTPAAPPGVAPASQFVAFGDFTGDGAPGVAIAGPVSHNDSSLTINEYTLSFLFRGGKTIAIGPSVTGVLAADFNRDGKADLAVVFQGVTSPGAVEIFMNNGDGTFANPVKYTVGTAPVSMAAMDINHDGLLDLAVADQGFNSATGHGAVFALLGKGDGTFAIAGSYTAGANPVSVTIADFNGDSNPDLGVTSADGTASILLGAGNGTFAPALSFQVGSFPQYLSAGDFNHDGRLDLAVANSNDQTISVFLGDGKGGMKLRSTYNVSYDPLSMILTDFNGDGNLDIINGIGDARGFGGAPSSWNIDTLLGNGDGTFQGSSNQSIPGYGNSSTVLVTGDFNGDGQTDAIMNDLFGGKLLFFAGAGQGTFQAPTTINVVANGQSQTGVYGAVAGDFNGDGKVDLAVSEEFQSNIAVLTNSASGLQLATTFPSGGAAPGNIVTGDFNKDGKPDLAVVNGPSTSQGIAGNVTVFFGGGNGAFQLNKSYPAGTAPSGLAVADLNGDGFPDLVVSDQGTQSTTGTVYLYLNDGKGGFGSPQTLAASSYPQAITVGDVNGDGKPDLVVATEGTNFDYQLAILLGNGNGTFQPASLISTDFGPSATAISDFNGDGKADIVVAHCCGDTDMTYLQGNGDGTFVNEVHFNGGASPFTVTSTDLNGDGKPDLVIGGSGPISLTALLNNSVPIATTVNGASFNANLTVAPNSIASAFGSHLASGTSLNSTAVTIQDSSGLSQLCTLFAVAPSQINFLIPDGLATGAAALTVQSTDGIVSKGSVNIAAVAPGIFTTPEGRLLNGFYQVLDSQGNQGPLSNTVQLDTAHPGQFLPAPISVDPPTSTVFVLLFGTGIRGAPQSQVTVKAGDVTLPLKYSGTQGQFPGLDQVNVTLPNSLKGTGDVAITVTAAGQSSNVVHLTIK